MRNIYLAIALLTALVGTVWLLSKGSGKSQLAAVILLTYIPLAALLLKEAVNAMLELRRKQAERARRAAIAEQFLDNLEG